MDVNLNGMIVLITRAASGIGRAIAEQVAASTGPAPRASAPDGRVH